jgi:very-short-patch-repair endonuclease/predicted SPOUT superfamily RNA methylase MTH1
MVNRKHTLESVSKYFKEQNCELLETEYINSNTKMKYRCVNNHITYVIYSSFKKGSRCAKCNGNEKYTFNEVYNYFIKQDCKLLETEYINSITTMKYMCKCKNESKITFGRFKNGGRCIKCCGNEKYIYEDVYNYFKEQGCELLETEYINYDSKMKYICSCGNKSQITFHNFKNHKRCMKCSGNEKLTYEYVYNFFKNQNCDLISTEYINANTKMKYLCKCGNESKITFSSFQKGSKCMKCSGNEKLTYEYVYNYFKENNCELLDTEYINTITKMRYICECKNETFTTFNNFQQGHKCNFCKNKTQAKLFNWLKQYFPNHIIENEKKFKWTKTDKSYLRYDFYIKKLNVLIELDGKQHFEQVSNWASPEEQQKKDNLKNNLANENGYKIIRICQQIVWNDKEDWEKQLKNAINLNQKLIKIGSIYIIIH